MSESVHPLARPSPHKKFYNKKLIRKTKGCGENPEKEGIRGVRDFFLALKGT
jgi:hypothetical protein